MGILALTFGIVGGLCAVMGIITATEVVREFANLGWTFWLALSGLLLLASIACAVGRSGEFE